MLEIFSSQSQLVAVHLDHCFRFMTRYTIKIKNLPIRLFLCYTVNRLRETMITIFYQIDRRIFRRINAQQLQYHSEEYILSTYRR